MNAFLKSSLKSQELKNLNGGGLKSGVVVESIMGLWSDNSLGRAVTLDFGAISRNSGQIRNQSNLLSLISSLRQHVYLNPPIFRSMRPVSRIKLLKSLAVRGQKIELNLSSCLNSHL